jgi:signal peptidase I
VTARGAAAAAFVALGVLVWLARRSARPPLTPISRYVVEGPSMLPAYRPGERLLVNRLAYVRRSPVAGDVVVIRDPERRGRLLLKRVGAAPDGAVYVLGDNAEESRDSRHFGAVPRGAVVGKAWRRY